MSTQPSPYQYVDNNPAQKALDQVFIDEKVALRQRHAAEVYALDESQKARQAAYDSARAAAQQAVIQTAGKAAAAHTAWRVAEVRDRNASYASDDEREATQNELGRLRGVAKIASMTAQEAEVKERQLRGV